MMKLCGGWKAIADRDVVLAFEVIQRGGARMPCEFAWLCASTGSPITATFIMLDCLDSHTDFRDARLTFTYRAGDVVEVIIP